MFAKLRLTWYKTAPLRKLHLLWYTSRLRVSLNGLITRALRRRLNSFAKSVISEAQERGIISNDTLHEIYGLIDRRLWPEHYR